MTFFFFPPEGEMRRRKLTRFLSCRPCFHPQITWERRKSSCCHPAFSFFFSFFWVHRHLIYFYQKTHRRGWNITTGPFKVSRGEKKKKTILPPNHKAWMISWIQYETGLWVIVHPCEMKGETLCATLPHLNNNMKMIGGRKRDSQKGTKFFFFFLGLNGPKPLSFFNSEAWDVLGLIRNAPTPPTHPSFYFVGIVGRKKFTNNQPNLKHDTLSCSPPALPKRTEKQRSEILELLC